MCSYKLIASSYVVKLQSSFLNVPTYICVSLSFAFLVILALNLQFNSCCIKSNLVGPNGLGEARVGKIVHRTILAFVC